MNRLKTLRKNKKLLQRDLALMLNITSSGYGFIETGKRNITSDILIKLADFYNVSTDYILGRTDDPNIRVIEVEEGFEIELQKDAPDLTSEEIEKLRQLIKEAG